MAYSSEPWKSSKVFSMGLIPWDIAFGSGVPIPPLLVWRAGIADGVFPSLKVVTDLYKVSSCSLIEPRSNLQANINSILCDNA